MDFFGRWRVRLGYGLAVVVLLLAQPTPHSILLGALIGLLGLTVRAYAAGYLNKQAVLTTTGPYALTRNPLYLGSSILALGAAVAIHSFWAAGLLAVYFAVVYSFVIRREELELRARHGAVFDAYASAVPLFFPRLTAKATPASETNAFSWSQFRKNHEYEASFGFLLLLLMLVVIWRLRTA